MYFARISEQKAITSLYRINLPVFIAEAVFTARYELSLIQTNTVPSSKG